mmetsp:Transcript_12158/g.28720  ORF Transcript_12158/g.28720 Transcript_12158/m.28720 type:complete len:267 (-) Transcript_12158:667-1467(-)
MCISMSDVLPTMAFPSATPPGLPTAFSSIQSTRSAVFALCIRAFAIATTPSEPTLLLPRLSRVSDVFVLRASASETQPTCVILFPPRRRTRSALLFLRKAPNVAAWPSSSFEFAMISSISGNGSEVNSPAVCAWGNEERGSLVSTEPLSALKPASASTALASSPCSSGSTEMKLRARKVQLTTVSPPSPARTYFRMLVASDSSEVAAFASVNCMALPTSASGKRASLSFFRCGRPHSAGETFGSPLDTSSRIKPSVSRSTLPSDIV